MVLAVIETVTVDAFMVVLLVSYVIPIVTGLVTKAAASATLKQVVTLILATISAAVTTATQQDGTAVISKETVMFAALSFLGSVASYLGVYKPHDVNARLSPEVGLG